MHIKEKRIILGSNSPRRKELLAGLDIEFTVDTGNNFEEVYDPLTPQERIPEILSEGKSYGFHRDLEKDEILITSDTAVVYFKNLSDNEIDYYVDTYKPFDKAGAYGIQEWIGYIGIDKIEGSYFTIMGLPVHLVYELLNKFSV